jgi:hypothetical protein
MAMPSLRTVDAILLLAVLGSSAAFVPASIPCMMRDRRGVVAGTSRHHHHQSACRTASSGDGNDENIVGGGIFAKHAAKVGCSARVLSRLRMSQPEDQSGSAAGKDDDTAEGDGSTMPSFYFSRRLDETGGVNRGSPSSSSRANACTAAFPHRIITESDQLDQCRLVATPPWSQCACPHLSVLSPQRMAVHVPWIPLVAFEFYRLRFQRSACFSHSCNHLTLPPVVGQCSSFMLSSAIKFWLEYRLFSQSM